MNTIKRSFKPIRRPAHRHVPKKWRCSAAQLTATVRVVDVAYLFDVSPKTITTWRRLEKDGAL